MKNSTNVAILAAGVAALLVFRTASAADTPEHAFSGKLGLSSEYEYRGISQSSEKPAGQVNLDYAHKSGFYLGTFVSNIKWLKDTAKDNGFSSASSIEWDVYGGYKFDVAKAVTIDVGFLHYDYPSAGNFIVKPNTDEVYLGVSYGPATLKYANAVTDTFGIVKSKGSEYIELSVNYPLPALEKLTINALLGRQTVKNSDFLSYNAWKLGATWNFGSGLSAGAYYKSTDAEKVGYTVQGRDWSKNRLVGFVNYSF
jgi:uncharacterized protein (TIGR02001 family)